MTPSDVVQIQRLLASEFESRGWEYHIQTGRRIAEAIVANRSAKPGSLASGVNLHNLARTAPKRSELVDAISHVMEVAPSESQEVTLGMRILFVAAGPKDEARLRLDAEHREIKSRIRSATGRDEVCLETALAARPTDLIDEMNRHHPTIIHLAGHGGPTGIALEDGNGNAVDVDTAQLSRLVSLAGDMLRLVVLNTCDSANQARPIVEHVDSAIGMTRSIGDDAARVFSAQLYSSLAEGVPLERAFEQARLQISLAGLNEDQTPRLFVRRGIDVATMRFVGA